MRILFLGSSKFAVPSLQALFDWAEVEIAGVVTQPDKPQGRRLKIAVSPAMAEAERYNLPVFQPARVSGKDFISVIKEKDIDLIVTVSFGEILRDNVLGLPKRGCINLHPSLLPGYRGASPVAGALLAGEKITGVTTFWLSSKMDSGDIILQKQVPVLAEDSRGTLEKRLAGIGASLLVETVKIIDKGTAPRIKQDEAKASYSNKVKKTDGLIDWQKDAVSIHNKIRAMDPWPAAYTYLDKTRIEIWKSEPGEGDEGPGPGIMKLIGKNTIGVGTGEGLLIIKELQAEGKKRITSGDFINGYRIKDGRMFGSIRQ